MKEQNSGILRAGAWSEICPWLCIFRTFRLAIGFRVLVMGALGILLTVTGWALLGKIFSVTEHPSPSTSWLEPYVECPWVGATSIIPDQPMILNSSRQASVSDPLNAEMRLKDPMSYSFLFLNQPLREGLGGEVHLKSLICLIFCGLWSLAVWSFFGAAICRIAAVQLAANERITWISALRHAGAKFLAYVSAPLIPLAGG